ncbi:potassium channel family protein [Pontibacter sp. E15-1]|uniref:potassium channel family protein n=1 Tax=Pontibacter sp. E15-1 TaxID=2919918 RepID=UPI001F4FDC2A|nr:potassium channel family protein [Pontibacter sp. E15-1]MCJ8163564.1 potassium channel family protein [Pontibacter sp. E15-1]
MDSTLSFVTGVTIVLLTIIDLVYTTFAPRGAGFISGPVTVAVWQLFLLLGRLTKSRSALTGAGIVIVFTILFTWVALLWVGNAFIYSASDKAVVNSTTSLPATLMERIYFTGYTLSTLGNGDFKAGTDGWRIFTAFISFTGLMFITIAITYMVPVLSAITARRALSIRISSIGHSPQRILLNYWNGTDFKKLETPFQSLTQDIVQQGQMHLSYPVLHYFQQSDKGASLLPNLAALDEALTLMLLYVPAHMRPDDQYLIPLRKGITTFISSLSSLYIDSEKDALPPIQADQLQKADLQLLEPGVQQFEQLAKRRRALKSLVEYNGWDWETISAKVLQEDMDIPAML